MSHGATKLNLTTTQCLINRGKTSGPAMITSGRDDDNEETIRALQFWNFLKSHCTSFQQGLRTFW